jgi:MFS family permease
MVGLDNTIVNVGLPEIGRSLHTSVAGLQWTVAAYTIVLASLLLFSGAPWPTGSAGGPSSRSA